MQGHVATKTTRLAPRASRQTIVAAAALAPLVAAWTLHWPALNVPLHYDADTLFVWSLVKALATHPWAWRSPELGLPGTLAWVDFPMAYVGQLAALKALTAFGLTPLVAINTYFFLGFAFTGGIAAWSLMQLGIGGPLALWGALAYALLPYHFMRMPHHLFLASYYLVPLQTYLLLTIGAADDSPVRRLRWLGGVCLLAAAINDIYYTFFFCYLLTSHAALRSFGTRRLQTLKSAAIALMATMTGAALAHGPNLWSAWQRTEPQAALIRPANDSETYGLKLVQMLLPAPGYHQGGLAKLGAAYRASAPLINENASASLGLALAAALLACTGYWLATATQAQTARTTEHGRLRDLGVLTCLAFIFGTVGGLGAVFAYGIMPYIRSTNRIVVFIAFFVTAATCLLAQRAYGATPLGKAGRVRRRTLALAYAAAVALVIWDTHDTAYFPERKAVADTYAQDQTFFNAVEAALGAGSRVYQLPFVTFPEGGYQNLDYSQLIPYIHTANLRYSFGAMRGTPADQWNRQTAALFGTTDGAELTRRLRGAGFGSVLVNQRLPVPGREALVAHLLRTYGAPRLQSVNNEFLLFVLPRGG
jgi:phosphoglycerol transferase